jgi:hypothetical protein
MIVGNQSKYLVYQTRNVNSLYHLGDENKTSGKGLGAPSSTNPSTFSRYNPFFTYTFAAWKQGIKGI